MCRAGAGREGLTGDGDAGDTGGTGLTGGNGAGGDGEDGEDGAVGGSGEAADISKVGGGAVRARAEEVMDVNLSVCLGNSNVCQLISFAMSPSAGIKSE